MILKDRRFELTPRIAVFAITILIKITAFALSAVAYAIENPVLGIFSTLVWILWFVLLFIVALPPTDGVLKRYIGWLKPAAKTSLVILITAGILELCLIGAVEAGVFDNASQNLKDLLSSFDRTSVYSDATASSHQAVDNFLDGKNPYEEADLIAAISEHDVPVIKLTPLRTGQFADDFPYPDVDKIEEVWLAALDNPEEPHAEFESLFNLPAGSFIMVAPLFALGISDYRIVLAILVLLSFAYIIYRIKSNRWRLFFAAVLLASLELWNSITSGETGLTAFPFLMLSWLLVKRKWWLSVFLIAIAVSIKQTAWFFLPVYLILFLREYGFKKAFYSAAIIGGIFLAFNLPYIVQDADLWISSLFAPMSNDMFPTGVGIIALVMTGLWNMQSTLPFMIMEILVFLLAIVWYYRNCRRYPNTGPILAVLPLFFAWRSGWSYFLYIDIILFVALLLNEYKLDSPEDTAITDRTNNAISTSY